MRIGRLAQSASIFHSKTRKPERTVAPLSVNRMRINLITNDPELKGLCERTLEEFSSEQVDLRLLLPAEQPKGDVCIWEFHPPFFPARLTPDHVRRTLFVVEADRVEDFRECLGMLRASIVLRPMLGSALRPFLEHSFRAGQTHRGISNHQMDDSAESQEAPNLFQVMLHANLKLQETEQRTTQGGARGSGSGAGT